MPLIDARPIALDLLFRPDSTVVVALTWPAGSLVGRSFSATLNGVAMGLSIVGDVMTLTAIDEATAVITTTAPFVLNELFGGDPEAIIVGRWVPSPDPGIPTTSSATITDGDIIVNVDVTGQAALTAHKNDPQGHPSKEWAFIDRDTTFGPVTPSNFLVAVPITDMVLTVPDSNLPIDISVKLIVRVANADGPAFIYMVLAPANAGEIALSAGYLGGFYPQLMPKIGTQPLEVDMSRTLRLPPHSPGNAQVFIGATDNGVTPKPVSAVVLQPGGHRLMRGVYV